jgi:hypothetical protein
VEARVRALFVGFALFPLLCLGQTFDHSHGAWDALLKKHVVVLEGGEASRLRYGALARERAALRRYLDTLSAVPPSQFERWSKAERMAFLVNAYNAFTTEKILRRYPDIRSIWDYGKVFGNPFRDRFFTLLGEPASLDRIEHEILRKPGAYDEPRVHFALNCASIGCPMLREEAYVPERLERQLEDQARRFLSDRSRNRFARGRLEVSKIFDWYKEDFEPRARYFARYAELLADGAAERALIAKGTAELTFLDYDWTLNDSP